MLLSDASTSVLDISEDAVISTITDAAATVTDAAASIRDTASVDAVNAASSELVTKTAALSADLSVVGLVAGQENYGLAIVCIGEAIWSFAKAPSFDHAKILVPAIVAAGVLGAVSGPMVTSGDAASVALGLEIATSVSVFLGASYVARLLAPFSPSPKEIAFGGLLVAFAGFFSFSQNLVVDGFVTLPALPSVPMPRIPSLNDLPF
eukprot:CAMPEP_0195516980 /NCGR_PEP_ID=MMETSP0794_2-20130614/9460_1 /TAXON_ID=515487 /ORGANISM="Stephanopyxis turris, Strain CCMP 815" /LENGTH=206 /DNA_ID=CAMNT_0040645705 /DNA_START=231 /DNA_END=851 /DNA_ORIENTATION=-